MCSVAVGSPITRKTVTKWSPKTLFFRFSLVFSEIRMLARGGHQVGAEALKEARTPLLDLDDVEQLESELAAFDAPPPPPLNIRVSGCVGGLSGVR